MKKTIIMLCLALPSMAIAQAGPFSLTLKIEGLKHAAQAKAYLTYFDNSKMTVDSVSGVAGMFQFHGNLSGFSKAELKVDHHGGARKTSTSDALPIYLEPGNINVQAKDSVKFASISGSSLNAEYVQYKKVATGTQKNMKIIMSEWSKAKPKDSASKILNNRLSVQYQQELLALDEIKVSFIKAHPDFMLSAMLLAEVTGPIINLQKISPLYQRLSERVRKSPSAVKTAEAIAIAQSTAVGSNAPEFNGTDSNGNTIKLADLRGKYIFIDFWASWCTPCRADNPYVVKAHQEFKDKNLMVVGISLDKDKAAWEKAIGEDGLTYTQILDSRVSGQEISKLYGISAIPQNFLIDPQGKIIGRNISGADLQTSLNAALRP